MKIEDLRGVNIYELPRINYVDRRRLPNKPGIYFAMVGDKCVYIGFSGRIKDRMGRHTLIGSLAKNGPVLIAYLVCAERDEYLPAGFLDFAELYFIQTIKPELNATASCSPKGIYKKYFETELGQEIKENYTQIRKRNWYRKKCS